MYCSPWVKTPVANTKTSIASCAAYQLKLKPQGVLRTSFALSRCMSLVMMSHHEYTQVLNETDKVVGLSAAFIKILEQVCAYLQLAPRTSDADTEYCLQDKTFLNETDKVEGLADVLLCLCH